MVSAVYPFWSAVAAQVGCLLRLQGRVSAAQIQRRLREHYGERETVARAARRVLRSFVDWGVVAPTDLKGIYQAGRSLPVDDPGIIAWLLEAALQALQQYGMATATSRGGLGEHPVYHRLEQAVCHFFDAQKAIYYASGYMGAAILLQACGGKYAHIFIDSSAHYSLWDAAQAAGLPIMPFRYRDAGSLEEPEVSGIAGTGVGAVFSRETARHLLRRYPGQVRVYWEAWDHPERLGIEMPGLLPLMSDDSSVEADAPYRDWLEAAGGLPWMVQRLERFDALEMPLRWDLGACEATRSRMRLPVRKLFYHRQALIARRDVSLETVPDQPPLPLRRLPQAEGERLIGLACDTSAVRYRELYGFTHGDPRNVLALDAGRGVVFYVWGVPPARRLPLRAYHAVAIWKNGVPIGYFEGLSLANRIEAGFNLYYTFREGETAWLYARLFRLFHQLGGIQVLALDPYQIGRGNPEAIGSGAFWFYRKLGFRSVDPGLQDLTRREESRLESAARRTPPALLRKLAAQPMVFELPSTIPGEWDHFEARRIGLRAVRTLRERYQGDMRRMRREGRRAAGLKPGQASPDWEALIAVMPHVGDWGPAEKEGLRDICRAKLAAPEWRYLRLLHAHPAVRRALLAMGDRRKAAPGGQPEGLSGAGF